MPDELRQQVPILRDLLVNMGVQTVSVPGLEADDIMGTLAKKSQAEGMKVTLVSGDRDLLQIADENILIRIPKTKSGKTTVEDYTPDRVSEEFGVSPAKFIQLKALMGDTADNIPGVPKVGPKTASELMQTYGSIDGIYEHIDEIKGNSVRESLREHRNLADLSLVLATIKIDADVSLDKDKAKAGNFFTDRVYETIKELGLKSFYSKFDEASKTSAVSASVKTDMPEAKILDSAASFIDKISGCTKTEAGLQFVSEDGNTFAAAFCTGDELYYYSGTDIESAALKEAIQKVTEGGCTLCFSDIKSQYRITGYIDPSHVFDAALGNYVLDPLSADHDIENIANAYLGFAPLSFKERFGKLSIQDSFFAAPDILRSYTCDGACISLMAKAAILEELEKSGQIKVYKDIELPLSYVLYDMESLGILVKADELDD